MTQLRVRVRLDKIPMAPQPRLLLLRRLQLHWVLALRWMKSLAATVADLLAAATAADGVAAATADRLAADRLAADRLAAAGHLAWEAVARQRVGLVAAGGHQGRRLPRALRGGVGTTCPCRRGTSNGWPRRAFYGACCGRHGLAKCAR